MTKDSTYKATITYREKKWVWETTTMTVEATSEEEATKAIRDAFRRHYNQASVVRISYDIEELKEVTE